MNRFSYKSAAARLAAIILSVLLLGTFLVGPVGAQDAMPTVQISVEAPSATPEAVPQQVEETEQVEILIANGVSVLSTDADIDESGWVQCRQVGGSQAACQTRVEKKLGRLGFALPDWSNPQGAVDYLASLRYDNKPWKEVISNCTRQMAGLWSEGSCWVHPATPTPTATATQEPTATSTSMPTATNTPAPTATGTQLPTSTPTATQQATNTPTATATIINIPTATSTAMPTVTVTPTRGDPWTGHTLTLGSFCSPTGAQGNPIGQAPGTALQAYIGAYTGANTATTGEWWGGDTNQTGWTQTTELHYGEQPRVWSYATSVDQPLLGWYFIDPTSGEIVQVAPNPADGFRMGGTRDSKWLASLHDCQPVSTGTPPPAPSGEESAALRQNGGGPSDWFTTLLRVASVLFLCALVIWGARVVRH